MRKRILFVASESDIVQSFPVTLRLAGHRVFVTDCGLGAIKQARTILPDLVLVDAMLPDMDGSTVIDILRRLPSTSELRTMLFKERGAPREPVNSSELLVQVAEALALCQEPMDRLGQDMESSEMHMM
jgi:DNA-binding response OmpR family regulator